MLKVITQDNLPYLWEKISLQDYPNNEILAAVINAIDEEKANKQDIKEEIQAAIDNIEIPDPPAAGENLGTVKSGGNVAIQEGIVTVLDDLHSHTIENINGLENALNETKDYADQQIASLIGTAPETLDTIGELAEAFVNNQEVIDVLTEAIAAKATQAYVNETFQKFYPVGSIYISTIATSPNVLFGFGTWERIEDRFLLAAGSSYGAGSSGGAATHVHTSAAHTHTINGHSHGSATHQHTINGHTHTTQGHTLTVSEIPSHSHKTLYYNGVNPSHSWGFYYQDHGSLSASTNLSDSGLQSTGGGGSHSHGNTGSTSLTTNTVKPNDTSSVSLTTNSTTPGNTGSSSSLPPYLAVYVWKRTA